MLGDNPLQLCKQSVKATQHNLNDNTLNDTGLPLRFLQHFKFTRNVCECIEERKFCLVSTN